MRHRFLRATVLVALMLAIAYPVAAGGWATVRLDEAPGQVVAGEPWRFGFLVKQHDRTPTNDVETIVRAVHMETGERIEETGTQVGEVGHFEAEIIFPAPGDWKWEIVPAPFAPTSLETLTVLPTLAESEPAAQPALAGNGPQRGLRITLTIDIGPIPDVAMETSQSTESVEVGIVETAFSPARIEIAPGTEVVWTNHASIAHSVMSDNLAFRDSSLLDHAGEFRQVFETPGTYHYWCGPHPNMTGTIVVSDSVATDG
jgi:plastocyanin